MNLLIRRKKKISRFCVDLCEGLLFLKFWVWYADVIKTITYELAYVKKVLFSSKDFK
jgi:hypothetical protein